MEQFWNLTLPRKTAMPNKIITQIFIVDDHAIIRKGLYDLINSEEDMKVCGEADNGVDALKKIEELQPDIVLTDIDMPKMSGIEIAKVIRSKKIKTKVIMLTLHDDESFYNAAMDSGAMGYVLKDAAISDIIKAINTVNNGKYFISPALTSFTISRIQEMAAANEGSSFISILTQTERKILKLISQNYSTKDIAQELFVSHRTIDSHRSNISSKLKIQGQNSLLRFALENKHKL